MQAAAVGSAAAVGLVVAVQLHRRDPTLMLDEHREMQSIVATMLAVVATMLATNTAGVGYPVSLALGATAGPGAVWLAERRSWAALGDAERVAVRWLAIGLAGQALPALSAGLAQRWTIPIAAATGALAFAGPLMIPNNPNNHDRRQPQH